jgi:hypothetical protein
MCSLAVLWGVLLLVFDYVLSHARLTAIILLIAAGWLVFSSSVFDVGLGLAVIGVAAAPMLNERKAAKRLP